MLREQYQTFIREDHAVAKRNVVGLDIGTTHVRGAEVSYGSDGPTGRGILNAFGQVALPLGAVQDGEVVEAETVASAIKQLWAEAKFSTKDVAIGVGNQRVIVRDLEVPWMPMPQLRQALPYQAQDILPMAADDALLDFYPTLEGEGNNGRVVRGLFVAAVKDTVEANLVPVTRAGLNPVHVDLNAFGLLRALSNGPLVSQTVAIVDVGARITNVIIATRGVPTFVRVLPAGGQDVTDAVSSAMKIGTAQAEVLKREVGVGYSVPADREAAAEATAAVTRSLIEAIRNTFVYFAQTNPSTPLEGAVLTGGGVHLPGFGQFLASATRLPVTLGNPFDNLSVGKSVSRDMSQGSEYVATLAIGLGSAVAA